VYNIIGDVKMGFFSWFGKSPAEQTANQAQPVAQEPTNPVQTSPVNASEVPQTAASAPTLEPIIPKKLLSPAEIKKNLAKLTKEEIITITTEVFKTAGSPNNIAKALLARGLTFRQYKARGIEIFNYYTLDNFDHDVFVEVKYLIGAGVGDFNIPDAIKFFDVKEIIQNINEQIQKGSRVDALEWLADRVGLDGILVTLTKPNEAMNFLTYSLDILCLSLHSKIARKLLAKEFKSRKIRSLYKLHIKAGDTVKVIEKYYDKLMTLGVLIIEENPDLKISYVFSEKDDYSNNLTLNCLFEWILRGNVNDTDVAIMIMRRMMKEFSSILLSKNNHIYVYDVEKNMKKYLDLNQVLGLNLDEEQMGVLVRQIKYPPEVIINSAPKKNLRKILTVLFKVVYKISQPIKKIDPKLTAKYFIDNNISAENLLRLGFTKQDYIEEQIPKKVLIKLFDYKGLLSLGFTQEEIAQLK
jgi:hypothetical protein